MADYNENVVVKQEPDSPAICQSESTIAWPGMGGPTFLNSVANSKIPLMTVSSVATSVVCKKEPQSLVVQQTEATLTQTGSVISPSSNYCASQGFNMCVSTIKKETTGSKISPLSSSLVASSNMLPTLKINSVYDSPASVMTVNSGMKDGIRVTSALPSNTNISFQSSVGNLCSVPASDGRHTGTHNISLQSCAQNHIQTRLPVLINNRVVVFLPVRSTLDVQNQILSKLGNPPIMSQTNSPVQNLLHSNSQCVRPIRSSSNEIYPVTLRQARPIPVTGSITNTNAPTSYAHATVFSKVAPVSPNRIQSKHAVIPSTSTRPESMIESVSENSYVSESVGLNSVKRLSPVQSGSQNVTMSVCKSKVYPGGLQCAQSDKGCTTVTYMNASNYSSIMELDRQSEDKLKSVENSAEEDDDSKNVSESEKIDKPDKMKPAAVVETSPRDKMTGIEFLSDIESSFRGKKISLIEMMETLDNGNDVMAIVEPGTIDYSRAKIFCDVAKKHGVCGIKPGIDNAFYTSLVSQCITTFETAVFRANVENTLKLRELEQSETQTVTVGINHVSTESESISIEKDSSETTSHCDNLNPVDADNTRDKVVKHGDRTQLQIPDEVEEPTDSYDGIDSLPKWNYTIYCLSTWRRAVRSLCISKMKCKDSVFYCYLCVHTSCSLKTLYQHILDVHFEQVNGGNTAEHFRNFTCTHCMFVVGRLHYVREHELSQHLSDFPCYFCGIPNNSRPCLLDHICNDHSEVFDCKFCSAKVKGRTEFLKHCWYKNHLQSLKSNGYFCLYCTQMFSESTNLKSHLQECHIDQPVPNIAERICYSCRHVFIDDHALEVHRGRGLHKKTMYSKESTILPSIWKQCLCLVALNKHTPVRKLTDGMDSGQLYNYDWIWWKKYLLKVKGVMRTVSANGRLVSYPYGELMHTCKVTDTLCHTIDKLPLVMDKLVQTAILKLKQVYQYDKVYLTEGVVAVLSSVWAFDKFDNIEESKVIKSNLRLFCRSPDKFVTSKTPEIQIKGKSYKYPCKNILRFCAMEHVNAFIMPAILDGILQIIFAHFPELDPSICLVSQDFWEMVVTVSRTQLLSKAFEYVQMKPLPWTDHVKECVYSFLNKCCNDVLDYGCFDAWKAILKNLSDSSNVLKNKEVEVSPSKHSEANRMPSVTATSQISEIDDCDSQEPETSLLLDVVSEPGHEVYDPSTHEKEDILSSSQHIDSFCTDTDKNLPDKESPQGRSKTLSFKTIHSLLRKQLRRSSLLQQMFDLNFWESEYGMKGLHMEMKTVCRVLNERYEKTEKEFVACKTVKETETKDTGLEPPMPEYKLFFYDSTVDTMKNKSNNDSVQEYSDAEPICKKRQESYMDVSCARYFADEERNRKVISSSIEIEPADDMEPLVTNKADVKNVLSIDSDEDSEDNDDLDDQVCSYDTEIVQKWKKSIVVPVVLNQRIFELCTKDGVSIDLYFYCYLCSYRTHDSKPLHEHIADTHFESKNNGEDFTCSHCFQIMHTFDAVRKHEIQYHLSEFPCYFCGIGFQRQDDMLLHICKKHGEMNICDSCGGRFFRTSEFEKHLEQSNHQGSLIIVFECLFCSIRFDTLPSLQTHMLKNHVEKPISNKAERVCFSCRHVFMNEKALLVHRGFNVKKIPCNLAKLASISEQPAHYLVELQKCVHEDYQKVSFKKRRWKEFLPTIKDVVRTVYFNCMTFHYPYGELVYNLQMSRALSHEIEKLPIAMDKLVQITLEKFVQIQGSKHISLSDHVLKMLATVFASEEYFAFLSSIDVRCNIDLFGQKTSCNNGMNTKEILIRKQMYKFPYKKILRYCAVEDVNGEVIPCLIDGLVRFVFAEFPLLCPDECLISEDFWQMITLVSRIPLFAGLLKSLQLEPFPRNNISEHHIHSFLFKCFSNEIQFRGVDMLSTILKHRFHIRTSLPYPFLTNLSPDSCNNISPGSDALPNTKDRVNVIQSHEQDALHENNVQDTSGAQPVNLVQNKQIIRFREQKHVENFSDLMKQMLDLEFWDSKYGIKHVNISMEVYLQRMMYEKMTEQNRTKKKQGKKSGKYVEKSQNDHVEEILGDVQIKRKWNTAYSCSEDNVDVMELNSPGSVKKAKLGTTFTEEF